VNPTAQERNRPPPGRWVIAVGADQPAAVAAFAQQRIPGGIPPAVAVVRLVYSSAFAPA